MAKIFVQSRRITLVQAYLKIIMGRSECAVLSDYLADAYDFVVIIYQRKQKAAIFRVSFFERKKSALREKITCSSSVSLAGKLIVLSKAPSLHISSRSLLQVSRIINSKLGIILLTTLRSILTKVFSFVV